MNLLEIINNELLAWEQQKQEAVAKYNQAEVAIAVLWRLTERMKEAAGVEDYKSSGEETEIASGD